MEGCFIDHVEQVVLCLQVDLLQEYLQVDLVQEYLQVDLVLHFDKV
jgi:hypothetical protein